MQAIITKEYDVVVVGGGMSGICAALAAAREGLKTALVHDRHVLGGNASSEIRMHICGADRHGTLANARETGIIEELLLKNRAINPQHSFHVQDVVFFEAVKNQSNLDIFLSTRVTKVQQANGKISNVGGFQLTTEKEFEFTADYFVDATGDGVVGYLAGAEYKIGREDRWEYNEPHAQAQSDDGRMGNSLMFTAKDMGYSVPFVKPDWAYTYTEDELKHRLHEEVSSGYWWIEVGGDKDTIVDGEEIRDELLKIMYGVWDHIKNSGNHGADNMALDWVGMLPGKRDSRRLIGDYVLTENDVVSGTFFDDAIAYGGWTMDVHDILGMNNLDNVPNVNYEPKKLYTIPYRCVYSKNICNLFIAGRAISATHLAFSSTRVMATCAVVGQAVGTAVAIAKKYNKTVREAGKHINEIQQLLLKNDVYIPEIKNSDVLDYALNGSATADSFREGFIPANVLNGVSRQVRDDCNCFKSCGLSNNGERLEVALKKAESISEIIIKFESDLSSELTISISNEVRRKQKGFPKTLVKDYSVSLFLDDALIKTIDICNNVLRYNKISVHPTLCNRVVFCFKSTYGAEDVTVYEVRLYGGSNE